MANKTSPTSKVAAGLGIAALAAAAAATYYFSGAKGKQRRHQVSALSKKAKEEMLKKIKSMNKVSKQAYQKAATEILAKYKQAKNIDPKELVSLGRELKGHWDSIAKDIAKLGAKAKAKKRK